MEKMETRGFPSGVYSKPAMSSGSPSSHASKPGEASRLFSDIESANRSLAG